MPGLVGRRRGWSTSGWAALRATMPSRTSWAGGGYDCMLDAQHPPESLPDMRSNCRLAGYITERPLSDGEDERLRILPREHLDTGGPEYVPLETCCGQFSAVNGSSVCPSRLVNQP